MQITRFITQHYNLTTEEYEKILEVIKRLNEAETYWAYNIQLLPFDLPELRSHWSEARKNLTKSTTGNKLRQITNQINFKQVRIYQLVETI